MEFLITVARPSHLDEVVKLCLRSLAAGAEASLPICKYKVKTIVNDLINDDHQLVVVAIVKGRVKGVVIGQVAPHAYATGLAAEDLALYVSPSLRGTDCYIKLAKAYAAWCDRIPNLIGSTLGLSQLNATTQVMHKLYEGMGYKRTGVTYLKLKGAAHERCTKEDS